MAPPTVLPPEVFTRAVHGLSSTSPRGEIELTELPAPRRLAPYSFALGASVLRGDEEVATGRLVLLHDPEGHEAWAGTLRLVSYVSAEIEPELAADPLLPGVGWSWLIDALEAHAADYGAAGGTVTQTASTRFGDLGDTSPSADLQIRASWSPLDPDGLAAHLAAWLGLLSDAAGLPPPGVAALRPGGDAPPGPP